MKHNITVKDKKEQALIEKLNNNLQSPSLPERFPYHYYDDDMYTERISMDELIAQNKARKAIFEKTLEAFPWDEIKDVEHRINDIPTNNYTNEIKDNSDVRRTINKDIADTLKASRKFADNTLVPAQKEIKQALDKINEIKDNFKKGGDAIAYPENTTTNPIDPTTNEEQPYEYVNHPSHYNNTSIETIEKMRRVYGDENTALWCEMTAFKYRDRIGNKPGNSIEQEMGKIRWCENKAKELRNIN